MSEIIIADPSSSLTLLDLRTEFKARGFDYLPDRRCNYYLNRAYLELCDEEDWSFLEASGTGTAPLIVDDLRTVGAVIDTTTTCKLRPVDNRNITDTDPDTTTSGTPYYYYVSGNNTINVYPVNTTDTLAVNYWKVPAAMVADVDVTVLPNRYQLVVVDGAVMYAYFDSDNFEAAQTSAALWESGKARMRDALLSRQHDEPDDIVVNRHSDYAIADWIW